MPIGMPGWPDLAASHAVHREGADGVGKHGLRTAGCGQVFWFMAISRKVEGASASTVRRRNQARRFLRRSDAG